MSNLKDTDFDDLFRRASDKYPLRTDSSDWDRMAAALEKDPGADTPDDTDDTDKRRRRRFFWWFLLLPLAGIGYYAAHNSGGHRSATPDSGVAITKPATGAATVKGGSNENATNASATDAKAFDNTSRNTQPNTTTSPTGGDAGGGSKTANEKPNTEPAVAATPLAQSGGQAAGTAGSRPAEGQLLAHGMPRKAPRMVNSNDPKNSDKIVRRLTERSEGHERVGPWRSRSNEVLGDVPARPATETESETEPNRFKDAQTSKGSIDPTKNPVAAAFTLHTLNRAPLTNPYTLNVKVTAPEKAAVKKDSTKSKTKHQSYLYAGLTAAPDLSTVKFQSTKGVGTTFGVLLGYAFSPHWAIETGAYLDRKRYYTDGEYFNTKKVYMPPNSYLENVDGTCYMWEIPLNVRYTFNPEAKTRWFATAGLSTYLMNREKYTYVYKYNTGTYNHSATWDLKKASQYPFSIIGVSAGFEQRLGNIGNLRVEPYLRVPLGGVGTGKLPILSSGINIGITRRLWK